MAGEDVVELSLEETNKLRIQLGLSPIPNPSSSESPEKKIVDKSTANNEKGDSGNSTTGKDEISLEETNRIRISLGLKPIPPPSNNSPTSDNVTSASYEDQENQAYQNWVDKQRVEDTKKRQGDIQEKIKQKQQEAVRRRAMASAKTLVEDGNEESALDWLKKMQNAQKNSVTGGLKASNASSRTKVRSKPGYSSGDLTGVKVAHDLGDIEMGQDVVLTLKDGSVLDDDEDILESSDLVAREKLKEKLEAKKGLNRLNYDDGEEDGGLLSKYDDIIGEKKTPVFALDGASSVIIGSKKPKPVVKKLQVKKKATDTTDSEFSDIINTFNGPSSDYQEAVSGGKPPKIKKKKKKAKLEASTDIAVSMGRKRQRNDDEEINFPAEEDDEQLQSILAASRRKVQRETKKKRIETPQEIAEKLKQDQENNQITNENNQDVDDDSSGIITISNTTDFLAVLRKASEEEDEQERKQKENRVHFSLNPSVDDNETPVQVEGDVEDTIEDTKQKPVSLKFDASMVAPETRTSLGLASTLKLLKSRGFIKEKTAEELAEEENRKNQRNWARDTARERIVRDIELSKKREKVRTASGYDRLSNKEREALAQKENREKELLEAKMAQKRFENYKPDIKLEYRDDDGRLLSTKDAYRHMSHQFHGKGPGKGKIEKKLKRDEEERKKMSKSIFGNDDDKNSGPVHGVRLQ